MREAVLALQSLARQSESAKNLPPVEFALRYGVVPPVLAGRARELAILEQLVDGIQAGEGDQSLLGLHGVRGQGKTALLRLLENMARQAGIHVVVLRAAKTGADFAQAVMEVESLTGRHHQRCDGPRGRGRRQRGAEDARACRQNPARLRDSNGAGFPRRGR